MSATGSLSQEQKSVLESTYRSLESMVQYLRAVASTVNDETDEWMLSGLVELAEMSLKRLPRHFPELQPLADELEKRVCRE